MSRNQYMCVGGGEEDGAGVGGVAILFALRHLPAIPTLIRPIY